MFIVLIVIVRDSRSPPPLPCLATTPSHAVNYNYSTALPLLVHTLFFFSIASLPPAHPYSGPRTLWIGKYVKAVGNFLMYKWENTSLFFIWNRVNIQPQLEGCVNPAWSAPYEFIQMFQSASPFYNKWNNSNMKIQKKLFALSNVHVLQQCMYTKSLFTSTCTCIRTLFTSTCIHFPHQHLLYFSHKTCSHPHVYIHLPLCGWNTADMTLNSR